MYIDTVPNRNSPPAILLRESYREGKKVKKRTIVNISAWPEPVIKGLRQLLQGTSLVPKEELFGIESSIPHGHVKAVLGTIDKLKLDQLLYSKPCRERDLVVAMIAERLLHPCSKLATTRLWHTTTLAQELSVADADADELYAALDWLLARKDSIEKKLANRHLAEDAVVLYDVSSSYYEGRSCPLVRYGHNRDGKRDNPIVVYGLLTDAAGCPVAIDVYPGNTGDPSTVEDQVVKLKDRFGLSRVVLVGDRGLLTQTKIDLLQERPDIGWISALRSGAIRRLVEEKSLQLSLFDTRNIAEISSPQYPGERLIACFNPFLLGERRRKRDDLLAATERALEKIAAQVRKRKQLRGEEIGIKVGKVINKYKMGKHFTITIEDNSFSWQRNEASLEAEKSLDGIYVIRTSESREQMSAEDTVRNYKRLAQVERAFRTLKGVDLLIRPIRHFTEDHVRAHIFLCALSYYVEWHMRKALAPLLFDDEQLDENRKTRDAVAPAEVSVEAGKKKNRRVTADGLPVHSFETLLMELGTCCRNRCRIKTALESEPFYQETELNPIQKKALQLLGVYPVEGNPK
jgi:transposase